MLDTNSKLIKNKVGLLNLAEELGVAAHFYNHPDPLLSLKVGPH